MFIFARRFAVIGVLLVASCGGGQTPAGSQATGAKNAIGGACASDAECQDGLFCEKGDPGGQCLKKCASSADCGAGAVCSDEKKCYHACQSKADCTRAGYTCTGTAPNMFCDVAPESEHH